MRVFLAAYRVLWVLLLPLALLYLLWRARRDPLYRADLRERFGRYPASRPEGDTVWVHAVSMGELRSAVPLINALLERGETVVITNFTPAGRRESIRVFEREIGEGRVQVVWVPLEWPLFFGRFFNWFRPKYGLVMEIEFWPELIDSARRRGVPLFLCNGQYPEKSYQRDKGRLRSELVRGFAGVMVKSDLQAERFRELGLTNIAVTGELRFDFPVPPDQLAGADALRPLVAPERTVITFASAVEREEDPFIEAMQRVRAITPDNPPLFVFVPRAPERFDAVAAKLAEAGLSVLRRSEGLDAGFALTDDPGFDVLLGDSFGEMYFYVGLADRVVVGGGFNAPRGAHNVIEPMALRKPVVVGPSIWTIEYIARDAIAAGALTVVNDIPELVARLTDEPDPGEIRRIEAFFETNEGAVGKTLDAIPRLLAAYRGG